MLIVQRALIGLGVAAALSASSLAQVGNDRANLNAYTYAVRCFAVASFARERGLNTDNGEAAYDMAQRLGARLGRSARETDRDVRRRTSAELTAMHRDAAYVDRTLQDCRRLRLL